MGALLRFLFSLAAHAAWMRMGQRGAVPPMRFKGKTTRLPAIAPWQMLAASWAIRYLWKLFGPEVKSRLTSARHPAARRLGTILPRPSGVLPPPPAPAASTPVRPIPAYNTQTLPPAAPQPSPQSSPLPSGSVLSSLRDSTA
jgi:hypothetical protein